MIITVTMNPSIDKTAEIASINLGGLNRLGNVIVDAGGKGINVSKMIKALGLDSVATGFLGGGAGVEIENMLRLQNVKTDFIRIKQTTRTNLKVLSDNYGITEFNEPGAEVTAGEMSVLREKLLTYAAPGAIFVFSGSLPPGAGDDAYFKFACDVKALGASVFLDADGEAFSDALAAKPDFIKPNINELKQHFGILADGVVVPCCLDGEGDIPLGNVFTGELSEILSAPRARAIVEGFRRRAAVEPLCQTCSYKNRF